MLTHSVGFAIAEQQLVRFNASRGKLKTDNLCPKLLIDSRVLRAKCPGCIHPKEPLVQSGILRCRTLHHAFVLQGASEPSTTGLDARGSVDVLTLLVVLFVFETPPLREHVGVLPQTPHVMTRKVW